MEERQGRGPQDLHGRGPQLKASLAALFLGLSLAAAPARAMFWEDDHSTNDPSNKYKNPAGCFVGPLIRGLRHGSHRAATYLSEGGRPPADRGQVVNKKKKAAIIVSSALLGATSGYLLALATEDDSRDASLTRSTLAGAGLLGGVLVGLYAIPESMNVDAQARAPRVSGITLAFNF